MSITSNLWEVEMGDHLLPTSPFLNPLPSKSGFTKFFAVRSAWRQHELSNSYKFFNSVFPKNRVLVNGYGYIGEADSGLNKQPVHFHMSL